MTLFSCGFPFAVIVRIWDILIVEGKKILYRVALAIFKLNEKAMLAGEMEEIYDILRKFPEKVDPDLLIKTALTFTFPGTLVQDLEKAFASGNGNTEIADICRMST